MKSYSATLESEGEISYRWYIQNARNWITWKRLEIKFSELRPLNEEYDLAMGIKWSIILHGVGE